jgi:hypothetical protein
LSATSDKVYQLLAHGRWFSPGTPASSSTKTDHHDIAEILLKVALKHQKSNQISLRTKINNLKIFVDVMVIEERDSVEFSGRNVTKGEINI